MKRARAYSHAYPSLPNIDEYLRLYDIIHAVVPGLVEPHCNGSLLKQNNTKIIFDVFPDPTMQKKEKPQCTDTNTVFITPIQYELLINTHSTVLNARIKELNVSFTNKKNWEIDLLVSNYRLEMEYGFVRWELLVSNSPEEEIEDE
jgi:hypothetical protein